jgi:hypothetical protein
MYDLLIENARICDGTGAPSFHGCVAVKDGMIAAVGNHHFTGYVMSPDPVALLMYVCCSTIRPSSFPRNKLATPKQKHESRGAIT